MRHVERDTDEAERWRNAVEQRVLDGVDPNDPLWRDTPYVDVTGPDNDPRWEREWRVPGGLRFAPGDVAFVFIPEKLHDKARTFFIEHRDATTRMPCLPAAATAGASQPRCAHVNHLLSHEQLQNSRLYRLPHVSVPKRLSWAGRF